MMEELTWTEDEVAGITGLLNLMIEHGRWNVDTKQLLEIAAYYSKAAAIRRKMNDHVFEVTRKIPAPKPTKKGK